MTEGIKKTFISTDTPLDRAIPKPRLKGAGLGKKLHVYREALIVHMKNATKSTIGLFMSRVF